MLLSTEFDLGTHTLYRHWGQSDLQISALAIRQLSEMSLTHLAPEEEDRFVLLGMSYALKILVVCHCYRGEGGAIRIISARKATPKEMKSYP